MTESLFSKVAGLIENSFQVADISLLVNTLLSLVYFIFSLILLYTAMFLICVRSATTTNIVISTKSDFNYTFYNHFTFICSF